MENYYQAASQNDASRLDALSCSPSKTMAGPITRMPDYSTERLRVVKLNCRTTFREGGYAIVACASEVYHTINGQESLIDMGSRTFHLSLEAGSWCVYGYNQP